MNLYRTFIYQIHLAFNGLLKKKISRISVKFIKDENGNYIKYEKTDWYQIEVNAISYNIRHFFIFLKRVFKIDGYHF